ncbi:MAG TPA: hypothetical protein VNE21_00700 [Mycobacteriales bacterium]|nr:hypothetical protein [Mycobacteriales bacterium]
MKQHLKTKLLATSGGALVLAMAAGGIAYASTGSSTPAPKAGSSASTTATRALRPADRPRLRREIRRVMRHTVHADLIVGTAHGFKTVEVDRGTLQSDTSNVLTIKRPDGPTVTATITSTTRFYGIAASALTAGDRTVIVQTGGDALVVAARPPSSTAGSGA